jgi:hypothetical protein
MLLEIISKGLNIIESRTGETLPEFITVLLIYFFIFICVNGLAVGADT